jgi:hypothetical protein
MEAKPQFRHEARRQRQKATEPRVDHGFNDLFLAETVPEGQTDGCFKVGTDPARDHLNSPFSSCSMAEPSGVAGANAPKPDLSVWLPGEKTVRGCDLVSVDFIVTGLDVDEGVLAFILRAEAWQHVALIDLVTAPCELLFAIPRLR